jgi:hypothetical protein
MVQYRPFSGANNEDPHDHLIKFKRTCSSLAPPGMIQNSLRLKLFPLSHTKRAEQWYTRTIWHDKDWKKLRVDFYMSFDLARHIAFLPSDIHNFRPPEEETMGVAWARFSYLWKSNPNMSIPDCSYLCAFRSSLGLSKARYLDFIIGGVFVKKLWRK